MVKNMSFYNRGSKNKQEYKMKTKEQVVDIIAEAIIEFDTDHQVTRLAEDVLDKMLEIGFLPPIQEPHRSLDTIYGESEAGRLIIAMVNGGLCPNTEEGNSTRNKILGSWDTARNSLANKHPFRFSTKDISKELEAEITELERKLGRERYSGDIVNMSVTETEMNQLLVQYAKIKMKER